MSINWLPFDVKIHGLTPSGRSIIVRICIVLSPEPHTLNLLSLNTHGTPAREVDCSPHLTGEDTDAQRGEVNHAASTRSLDSNPGP